MALRFAPIVAPATSTVGAARPARVVDGARRAEALVVETGEKGGDAGALPFIQRGLGVVVHGFHDVAL